VVPDEADFLTALDPVDVVSPAVLTAEDGRFEVSIQAHGSGQLLIGRADGGKVRYGYGDASELPPVTDLGDIELPPMTNLLAVFPVPDCELYAAGPVDALGMEVVASTFEANEGRYRLRLPEPGLWWLEASCAGEAVAVTPRLVRIDGNTPEKVVEIAVSDGMSGP
jgi:hypothetical protein